MKIEITKEEARELFDQGYPVRQEAKRGYHLWLSAAGRNWPDRFDEEDVRWFKDPSRKTYDEAAGHIFRRESFRIQNMQGIATPMQHTPKQGLTTRFMTGSLPDEWVDTLASDVKEDGVAYVVFSYETPIAWVSPDGEVT